MIGFAQSLYTEIEGKPFGLDPPPVRWPFLRKLVREGVLEEVDLLLAGKLLPKGDERCAALLAYLSAAGRGGHLCIRASSAVVMPEPEGCLDPLDPQDRERLLSMVKEGAAMLPETEAVRRKGELVYFERHYVDEQTIMEHFERISTAPPTIRFDDQALSEKGLQPEQEKAVRMALKHSLVLMSGGPGTGKTFTAGRLVSILLSALTEEQRDSFKIALAAPTGKAAANLQKSIGIEGIKGQTLHALLGRMGKTQPRIPFDLVIVDECSMIDAKMLARLFQAVKPGSRLLMLGDKHQLPPVESGALFHDLVERSPCVAELKTCLRTELKAILDVASAVNSGKSIVFDTDSDEMCAADLPSPERLAEKGYELFPVYHPERDDPSDMQEGFNRFRILSPMRKGPYGVDALNALIHEKHRKKSGKTHVCPIMVASNHYKLQLFNGETGILVKKNGSKGISKGDYALFGEKRIPAALLPKFEYAYCLSVHKSQGSEFDHVWMLMPEGAEVFGREVLYTGITRARKGLKILGCRETLERTIARRCERLSGF